MMYTADNMSNLLGNEDAERFQAHEISLDNGTNYLTADEAMPIIDDRGLWETVVESMDAETREAVNSQLAPCSNLEFLRRYLEIADLVIG